VNEETKELVEIVAHEDPAIYAVQAFELADIVRPNWKAEGLKLWIRVGGQG